MNDTEWKQFLVALFNAFPSLRTWLNESTSDNGVETTRVWRRTLAACSYSECNAVLDSWISGKREAFRAYERDQVALVIRSHVMFDRDALNRHRRNIEELHKHQQAKAKAYKRSTNFLEIWRQAEEYVRQVNAGEISEQEFDRIKEELVKGIA